MLVSDVMTAVRDLVTVATDAQLQRHIAAAVRDYGRYQPRRLKTDLTTTADEDEYDLPADCTGVDEVVWYPGGAIVTDADRLTTFEAPVRGDDPAGRYIDELDNAERERRARGSWETLLSEGKLKLYPTPESDGLTVEVYYLAGHALSGSGATLAYATIPDAHFDAVVKLTAASVLQAQAAARANQFDYKDGLSQVVKGHLPDNLVKMAARLRAAALGAIR